jgi:hypothetical protein
MTSEGVLLGPAVAVVTGVLVDDEIVTTGLVVAWASAGAAAARSGAAAAAAARRFRFINRLAGDSRTGTRVLRGKLGAIQGKGSAGTSVSRERHTGVVNRRRE